MHDVTQRNFTGGELLAGKYRVERVLGEGGMGVVLAARHEALNTNVAIKLLRSDALEQTDIVGRFVREARAAVSLRSEHVARVFDVGNLEDGRPYIVMERLEGRDLGDVIEQSPLLPIHDAVDFVLQACEAIAEAHAAGIIHRDLKPRNLFLTHTVDGRPLVKVLDFGISKMGPQAGADMQLTRTTEVIGSPSYMSPEQLRSSRNVDTRTDIWALGVILYELLTKRVPFYADTVTELAVVIVTEREQPARALRPDCPEALEVIIGRCLQKQPEHRFQSVLDLVAALEPYTNRIHATVTERVRAVAAGSGRALPPTPSSGALPAPVPSASSRVNVHGGTSVAWGETQSMAGAPPTAPTSSRAGLAVGLVAGGLLIAGVAAGGAVYFVKRSHSQASPPAVADDRDMPLPPGRKDLPPLPSASASVVETTPPPASSSAATPSPPDEPPPTPLPEKRKTTTSTSKTAQAPAPKPTQTKPDDLSNIGRR